MNNNIFTAICLRVFFCFSSLVKRTNKRARFYALTIWLLRSRTIKVDDMYMSFHCNVNNFQAIAKLYIFVYAFQH